MLFRSIQKCTSDYNEAQNQFKILEGEVEENEDYINKLSREKAIKEKAFMKLKQEVEKRGKKGKKVEGKSYECMLFIIV